MNFSAPRRRRRLTTPLRTRALRAAPVVLLAVALGGTAPAGPLASEAAEPGLTVHGPAPVAEVLTAATTPVAPASPDPDRGPSRAYGTMVPTVPAAGPVTLPRSDPARLRIPAIGVDSELVGLGLQDDGRMEVSRGAFPAGWYTGAPTPGELGPAVLAGHVDHSGTAGVFARLGDLRPGDRVEVDRGDGGTATFRVTRVEQHPKDAFPTAAVYGDIDHAGLRLITCGGVFDRSIRSYEDNIVVFAELT